MQLSHTTRTQQTAASEISLKQATRIKNVLEPLRVLHHTCLPRHNTSCVCLRRSSHHLNKINEYRFFNVTQSNFHHIIRGHIAMEKNTASLCASFSVLLPPTNLSRVSLLPSHPVPQLPNFSFILQKRQRCDCSCFGTSLSCSRA